MIRRLNLHAAARVSALAVVLASAGCITPVTYGPLGVNNRAFGYRDNPNPDGSHTIFVAADSATSAHTFWDQRAREICGSTAYEKNIFRAQRPVVTTTGYAANPYGGGSSYQQDVYGSFLLEGYLRCEASAGSTTSEASQVSSPEPAPIP